ncbi:8118_t:CDS:2 [Funneliformis geosporum]|nr:8118_t:CDS:2 [Funneliformis geosporum]
MYSTTDNIFSKIFSFDQLPRFERPQFIPDKVVTNEKDVHVAIDINICLVLNRLIGLKYDFSKHPTYTSSILDFTYYYLIKSLILVIEAKRKHVLEDIKDQTFPDFYQVDEKARMGVTEVNRQAQNDKKVIAELSAVDTADFVIDQQNYINTKSIEDKKIGDFIFEESANIFDSFIA